MPIHLHAWNALQQHHAVIRDTPIRGWFDAGQDGQARVAQFSLEAAGLYLDYSKNRITPQTMALLMQLADEAGVSARRDAMFAGEHINATENRAALHVALRANAGAPFTVDGAPVMPAIHAVLARMRTFSTRVRSGAWTGSTGKRITDVINIGIGGSDLGPRMVCTALSHLAGNGKKGGPRVHFVSNVDGTELAETLAPLDPASTLVIVCSKTFTTLETMANACSARDWFLASGVRENQLARHFVAVSTNTEAVRDFGIDPANMFEFWDWIGGRFSLWSSVGLSIALAVGFDAFDDLLAGGRAMDEHFRTAPLDRNLPVVMGMLGIWYRNFFDLPTSCMAPYSSSLSLFPAFLQQLEMESNGKSVQLDGKPISTDTAPVVWGTAGTNGQHAYFQLIHQGSQVVPVDFVAPLRPPRALPGHHAKLLANCFAQAEALMRGRSADELRQEGVTDEAKLPHMVFEGNRPSNTLLMQDLTPHVIGALIALYEHRTFVQGVVWNINSFDQWGVELGKILARPIEAELNGSASGVHDASTTALIARARAALRRQG